MYKMFRNLKWMYHTQIRYLNEDKPFYQNLYSANRKPTDNLVETFMENFLLNSSIPKLP